MSTGDYDMDENPNCQDANLMTSDDDAVKALNPLDRSDTPHSGTPVVMPIGPYGSSTNPYGGVPRDEDVPDTEEDVRPPKVTFKIQFSRNELAHLRDLLSIRLPPGLEKTVSQSLAEKEGRPITEASVWKKIGSTCDFANVPMADKAPDFVVGIVGLPEMKVFEIASEYVDGEDDEDEDDEPTKSPFGQNG